MNGRALIAASLALATFAAPVAARADTQRDWFPLHPSLLQRAETAGAAVGKDIYVVGGLQGPVTSNQVERYDTVRDSWTLVKPMPVTLNHPSAVSYGGELYVLGGYYNGISNPGVPTGGRLDVSDRFLRYDPASDTWSNMPRMPIGRAAASAAVIGHKLYIAGGRNAFPTYTTSTGLLKRLDIFNFKTDEWSHGADMSVAREHAPGAAAGGDFYVIGGRLAFDQATGAIAEVERYSPSDNSWTRVKDLPLATNGFPAVTAGGRIIVFGGEEPSTPDFRLQQERTEAYDPAANSWSALPNMRTPRGAMTGVVIGSRVYAIEGIEGPFTTLGPFFSNVVEALDVASRSIAAKAKCQKHSKRARKKHSKRAHRKCRKRARLAPA